MCCGAAELTRLKVGLTGTKVENRAMQRNREILSLLFSGRVSQPQVLVSTPNCPKWLCQQCFNDAQEPDLPSVNDCGVGLGGVVKNLTL